MSIALLVYHRVCSKILQETPGMAHRLVDDLIQRCNKHEWERFKVKWLCLKRRGNRYIGLIYGRYIHFRILKFPLTIWHNMTIWKHHAGSAESTPSSAAESMIPICLWCHWITGWWLSPTTLKNMSQLGLLFPIYGKLKMFQTTNQMYVCMCVYVFIVCI